MKRTELEDTILDIRKQLAFYERITTSCGFCEKHTLANAKHYCGHHSSFIPEDFVNQPNECPDWDWDDIPF